MGGAMLAKTNPELLRSKRGQSLDSLVRTAMCARSTLHWCEEMFRRLKKHRLRILGFAVVVACTYMVTWWDKRYFVGVPRRPDDRSRLCVYPTGRMGNLHFEFSSMFGIARTKQMVPFISEDNELLKTFVLEGLIVDRDDLCGWFKTHTEVRNCAFDSATVDFSNATDIALKGFYQSWRYFKDSETELRKMLRIKPDLRAKARKKLDESISQQLQGRAGFGDAGVQYVGIHVRRGDFLEKYFVDFGYVVVTKEYLQHATDFFRAKFKRVVFVVCSQDLAWCRENLVGEDIVFIEGQRADLDMTVLTLCHHTIMSVGTFGWWSAWLTNGLTVYYKRQYREGSDLALQYHLPDFFPPHWIGME